MRRPTTTTGEERVSRFTLRLVTLALVSAVVVIGGASTALASMATATQNADITVVASRGSNNEAGGDVATVGDIVTASASISNNSKSRQVGKVSSTLTAPDGTVLSGRSPSTNLSPGETYTASDSIVVKPGTAAGTYVLTVTASNKNGSSSASTSITVY
jgi:hypothetical protein